MVCVNTALLQVPMGGVAYAVWVSSCGIEIECIFLKINVITRMNKMRINEDNEQT